MKNIEQPKAYVGVCVLRLETPWVRSLKEKRTIIKPALERCKHRYPVSVARLAGLNAHSWEMVGLCAISHDAIWLTGMLQKASSYIRAQTEADVFEVSFDVEQW